MALSSGLLASLTIGSISPERLEIYILGGLIGVFVAALIAWAKTGQKERAARQSLQNMLDRL